MKKLFSIFLFLLICGIKLSAQDTLRAAKTDTVMPEFNGGYSAMSKYLALSVHYPVEAKEKGHQGTVYVKFVVEKDGSISNFRAMKEVAGAPELSVEAIRVISAMPQWVPGTINGKPVRVEIAQPVMFRLQ